MAKKLTLALLACMVNMNAMAQDDPLDDSFYGGVSAAEHIKRIEKHVADLVEKADEGLQNTQHLRDTQIRQAEIIQRQEHFQYLLTESIEFQREQAAINEEVLLAMTACKEEISAIRREWGWLYSLLGCLATAGTYWIFEHWKRRGRDGDNV